MTIHASKGVSTFGLVALIAAASLGLGILAAQPPSGALPEPPPGVAQPDLPAPPPVQVAQPLPRLNDPKQYDPAPPKMQVEITIEAPSDGYVDEAVTFKVHLRNTSTRKTLKNLDLFAVADPQSPVTQAMAAEFDKAQAQSQAAQTLGGKIREQLGADMADELLFGLPRVRVGTLAPRERKTIEIKLSPARIGDFGVQAALIQDVDKGETNMKELGTGVAAMKIVMNPKTPLEALVPSAPRGNLASKPMLARNLSQVTELAFQEPLARSAKTSAAMLNAARTIDRINYVNQKKTDAFMETLLTKRSDLAGLSFAMGDACRLREERSRQFATALVSLRRAMNPGTNPTQEQVTKTVVKMVTQTSSSGTQLTVPVSETMVVPANPSAKSILEAFQKFCEEAENADARLDPAIAEHAIPARIAALMQVLGPKAPELRIALVKYLASVSHVEATRALARLAIFSEEDDVRHAAVKVLKVRSERDYTDIVVQGMSYPWPAVAHHASEAIVKLERTDLLDRLVQVLEKPDPRSPQMREVDGKKISVVREMVRVNHHRNCLLCHSPSSVQDQIKEEGLKPFMDKLVAQVPLPSDALPVPDANSGAYGNSIPDLLVRIDVTYLRQDFSVRLPVSDAKPWPEMQRFDFLVRNREITAAEAKEYQNLLDTRQPGVISPYHRAALFALRELTGLEAAPTAQAWRKLLAKNE